MPNQPQPRVIIIAGPNGAGKSTFAQEYLPNEASCPRFVNADLIAAGLSPFDPAVAAVRAGRLMLDEIRRHAGTRDSFAFETTLAGRGYSRLISEWRDAGYWVHLTFLKLHDADLAVERVATRVAQGGHDVPEAVIRRRFAKGWSNFQNVYRELVDSWRLYDNSGEQLALLEDSTQHE
jgi:predicted ABC-type ATPase